MIELEKEVGIKGERRELEGLDVSRKKKPRALVLVSEALRSLERKTVDWYFAA